MEKGIKFTLRDDCLIRLLRVIVVGLLVMSKTIRTNRFCREEQI